jgi:hypothetical protein
MTVGWIYEGDLERFFERSEKPASQPSRSLLHCPFCGAAVPSSRELLDHLHATHTSRRPALLIAGREPGHLDSVRSRVSTQSVELIDCDHLEIAIDDAEPVRASKTELSKLLSAEGARRLTVKLSNHGSNGQHKVVESYLLRISIPPEEALEAVDKAFVQSFGKGALHIEWINTFKQHTQGWESDEYVEGLAEYVRGVLLKDGDPQTGVSGGRSDWSEAYKRSLDILLPRQRPLPTLLCGLMRFALNDFSAWSVLTGFPDLDQAHSVLGPLTDLSAPPPVHLPEEAGKPTDVCPVDAGVSCVLKLVRKYVGLTRWSLQDDEKLRLLASSTDLNAFDRAKVRALWAWSTLRLAESRAATEPLGALLGSDCFGLWASQMLEGPKDVR